MLKGTWKGLFQKQLRVNQYIFDILLNVLRPALLCENMRLWDYIARENVLTLGSYLLAHGNWYMRIGRNFNVGRLTALEAVQDVVEALFGLRNDYIKFPITEAESELPNIVGAIDESHIRMATLQAVLWTISVAISNMNSLSILL